MDRRKVQGVVQLSMIYVWNKQIQKKYQMCIGREDDKNIFSYVDFLRLFNIILRFPELSADFLTNGIIFPNSNRKRTMEWRKIIDGLTCCVK